MIFFALMFVLIVILLFLPIELQVKAKREQNNDKIQLNIYIFNKKIKFGIDIPYLDTFINNHGIFIKAEEKLETGKREKDRSKKKQTISMETLTDKFYKYVRYQRFIRGSFLYFSKKIKIEKFILKTTVGFSDAALTGFVTGLIWTIHGLIFGQLFSYKDINDYCMDIRSEFNNPHFLINFNCIIKFKLVYIINAVIHGIRKQLKGG